MRNRNHPSEFHKLYRENVRLTSRVAQLETSLRDTSERLDAEVRDRDEHFREHHAAPASKCPYVNTHYKRCSWHGASCPELQAAR